MEPADLVNATLDEILAYFDDLTGYPTSAPTLEEPPTIHETWIPIYSTLGLSILQSIVLLIIFECGRRNRHVADVYERRRLLWPSRVPPPMMQKRGCLCGWLAFEWFRVKCADPEYLSAAAEEQMERLVKEQERKAKKEENENAQKVPKHSASSSTLDEELDINKRRLKETADEVLLDAEKQCLDESPYYFPDTLDSLDIGIEDDLDLEDPDELGSQEMVFDLESEDNFSFSGDSVGGSHDFAGEPDGTRLDFTEYQVSLSDEGDMLPPSESSAEKPAAMPPPAQTQLEQIQLERQSSPVLMTDLSGHILDVAATSCQSPSGAAKDNEDLSDCKSVKQNGEFLPELPDSLQDKSSEGNARVSVNQPRHTHMPESQDNFPSEKVSQTSAEGQIMGQVNESQQGTTVLVENNMTQIRETSQMNDQDLISFDMHSDDGSILSGSLKGDNSSTELGANENGAYSHEVTLDSNDLESSDDASMATDDTFGVVETVPLPEKASFGQHPASATLDSGKRSPTRVSRRHYLRQDTNSTTGSNDSTFSKPGSILRRIAPRRTKSDAEAFMPDSSRKVRFFGRSASEDGFSVGKLTSDESMDASSHRRDRRMSDRSMSSRFLTNVTPNMKSVKELLRVKEIAKATGNAAEYLKVKELIRATKMDKVAKTTADVTGSALNMTGSALKKGRDISGSALRTSTKLTGSALKTSTKLTGSALRSGTKFTGSALRKGQKVTGSAIRKGRKRLKKSASKIKKKVPTLNTVMADQMSRMRTYQQDIVNWDGDIVSTTSKSVTTTTSWFSTLIRKKVLKLQDGEEGDEEGAGDDGTKSRDLQKKTQVTKPLLRRPLDREQAELLRCVGLDSFVLLQFLEFGFAVSFWPFLFAVLVLIPTYRTGENGEIGFFTTTVTNLKDESPKLWLVVIYGYLQILLILRRLWVEWETFIPLRNDFLERGDFIHTKHQDQYRKTCIIEYIPKSHCKDKTLFEFFDALFPGQIRRAEVLLNAERIRTLIKERLHHIEAYETAYAKKVYNRASYLRKLYDYEDGRHKTISCCGNSKPKKPEEPKMVIRKRIEPVGSENEGVLVTPYRQAPAMDKRTVQTLPYHHQEILRLNNEIEDEFIRLARAKNRKLEKNKEGMLSKWLGLRYLMGLDNGRVHSSTAFVEFDTLTTKQQAIQCNLTGANALLSIKPVPEVRDILWDNAHVSRKLIDRRKLYLNGSLLGCLLAWSILVATIRSYANASDQLSVFLPDALQVPVVTTILDNYVPALLVEAIVRYIALALRYVTQWIRFKTVSEIDSYVLIWYFTFRLITFVFVIIGGNLLETGESFFDDPIGFVKDMARDAADQSQFFMSYVLVAGGLQIFLRISQVHNIFLFWFTKRITKEEAVSLRKLDFLRVSVKKFHLDEFIPLFLFVFMISILYGWIAPLSNLFVALFFKSAFKVFKYMTLYIYGNDYEGGGFLFYQLTDLVFLLLYGLIILLTGYFSLFGSAAMAGVFSLLLFVTIATHRVMIKAFTKPSETLALTKALEFDTSETSPRDRALKEFFRAKAFLEENEDDNDYRREMQRLMPSSGESVDNMSMSSQSRYRGDRSVSGRRNSLQSEVGTEAGSVDVRESLKRFARRYEDEDAMSDITGATDDKGSSRDFFIYRQPSLNRSTWETMPRPYWETAADEVYKVEIWR